ncbi:MAG TPA: hypothetical protein VFF73_22980 [Planctomycetota bacterium]|nr:hypothetical protein [Planctomycetota bacterium]
MLLLALALGGGCSSAGNHYEPAQQAERSPLAATLLAIFPGIFVHGLGTMYGGKGGRGTELLEEEGMGVGCMAIGAGLSGLAYLEMHDAETSKNETSKILSRIGEWSSVVGAGGFAGFGLILFFDSWIKDMAGAGAATVERNNELRRRLEREPVIGPDAIADVNTAGAPAVPLARPN